MVKLKIRTKIFVVYLIIFALVISFLVLFQERFIRDYTFDKMKKEDSYAVSQLLQNVDNLLYLYETTADTMFYNSYFTKRLPIDQGTFFEANDYYLDQFRPYIDLVTSTRDISKITVYTSLAQYPFADILPIDDEIKKQEWYKESSESTNKYSKRWSVLGEDPLKHRHLVRLTARTFDRHSNEEMLICFDIDIRQLMNLVSRQDQTRRYIMILQNGKVLLDNKEPWRQGTYTETYDLEWAMMLEDAEGTRQPYSEVTTGKSPYLITSSMLHDRKSVAGLTLYSFTPLAEFQKSLNTMRMQTLGLFVFAFIFAAIVIYLLSLGLTSRLSVLVKRMKGIDIHNLNDTIEVKGHDEIAQLGTVFNDMTERIDHLFKEVMVAKLASKELEIRRKESELYALQTQINPHYLFNTLNAICGKALENGDRETARIVQLLAASFRNILQKSGEAITLREELDIIQTYLEIQVFRFGKKLHYELDISEGMRGQEIPRLALQTLVENAIIHGVEKTDRQVNITIWYEPIDACHYALHVTDDGPGMSETRLAEVQSWLVDGHSGDKVRIGLVNIHQRLQFMYGEKCGLRFMVVPNHETTITMVLPYTFPILS